MSGFGTQKVFAILIAIFLSVPFFVRAQTIDVQALLSKIQALQTQLSVLQGSSNFCDLPTRTMRRGSSGDEVSRLQQFLARDASVYPEGLVTGYFGTKTVLAVQRWQVKNGILPLDATESNGFGAVGPRTLAAMRLVWCLQSSTTAAPFVPPYTSMQSGTAQKPSSTVSASTTVGLPTQITFTAPIASTSVRKGSILITSWQSTNAPLGASVSISLGTPSGAKLAVLKSGLTSSGTFYWAVPAPSSAGSAGGACSGSAIECLTQLAGTENDCGALCSLADGMYVLYGQVVQGAKELAHAQSPIFFVSSSDTSGAGTNLNFGSNGTSSYSSTFGQSTSWTSTDISTQGQSCLYSGVPYADGIALEITCADVKAVGQSCGTFGGMRLSCRNGVWVDDKGVAQSVRNVTTTNTAGSCTTPWGSMIVTNGNEVPYEPFFSGGMYSGAMMLKLMRCSSGKWQTCDTVGDNCH